MSGINGPNGVPVLLPADWQNGKGNEIARALIALVKTLKSKVVLIFLNANGIIGLSGVNVQLLVESVAKPDSDSAMMDEIALGILSNMKVARPTLLVPNPLKANG